MSKAMFNRTTALAIALVVPLFYGVASASVTNITINDLTDTLSVTGPGVYNCVNSSETCRQAGAADFPFGTFHGGDPTIGTYKFNIFDDASRTHLSDTLTFFIGFGGFGVIGLQNLVFISDLDNGSALTPLIPDVSDILPHSILDVIEDGTVQTVLTVTSGNDILNIGFQSDVPEPASLTVLGLGLAGLGAIRRRRT